MSVIAFRIALCARIRASSTSFQVAVETHYYRLVQRQSLRARLASIERQIGGRIATGKDRGALVIDHMLYSGV